MLSIADSAAYGGSQTQSFSYDALDRLATAQAAGGSYGTYSQRSYQYSNAGNLTNFEGTAFAYNDAAHKHGVTHIGGVQKYWYDANGNATRRIAPWGTDITLTYDAENRLTQVSNGVTASYTYDGDGNRVKAVVNGTTSIFVGNYYEVQGSTVKKYYYAGSVRVAERNGGTLYFLLSDHLGGTAVTTDANGNRVTELRYLPYGDTRYNPGSQITTYRFTGQRWDSGTGLYFYNARWYDPLIGRFIQADTIVSQPGNPQDLNRYTYCRNNPLRFIDPSGYDPLDQAWRDEFRKVHGRDPTAEDMQIRLFSIAFPDEWNWGAFYTPDGALRPGAMTKIFSEYPAGRDWAGMPAATGRLAGWYTDAETEAFVRDIGSLFAGLLTRFEEANGWRAVLGGWVHAIAFVGGNGLPGEYRGNDSTGNVHHWAWSLNLGYIQGGAAGRVINEGRELSDSGWNWQRFSTNPNHRADVAMGNIGVAMGAYMSNGIWPSRAPQALQNAWSRMPLTVRAQ